MTTLGLSWVLYHYDQVFIKLLFFLTEMAEFFSFDLFTRSQYYSNLGFGKHGEESLCVPYFLPLNFRGLLLIWNKYCRSSPHGYISTLTHTSVQSRFSPREVLRRWGARSDAECTCSAIFLPPSSIRRVPGVARNQLLPPSFPSPGKNACNSNPATTSASRECRYACDRQPPDFGSQIDNNSPIRWVWCVSDGGGQLLDSWIADFINVEDRWLLTKMAIIWAICKHISNRAPY